SNRYPATRHPGIRATPAAERSAKRPRPGGTGRRRQGGNRGRTSRGATSVVRVLALPPGACCISCRQIRIHATAVASARAGDKCDSREQREWRKRGSDASWRKTVGRGRWGMMLPNGGLSLTLFPAGGYDSLQSHRHHPERLEDPVAFSQQGFRTPREKHHGRVTTDADGRGTRVPGEPSGDGVERH